MYLLKIIATIFSIFKTITCKKSVFQILDICLKISKKVLSFKLLRKKIRYSNSIVWRQGGLILLSSARLFYDSFCLQMYI